MDDFQHLKDITHIPEYTTEGYTGPAFKVGAGVQAQKIYKVAYGLGLMVVGGVCDVNSLSLPLLLLNSIFHHFKTAHHHKVRRSLRRLLSRRWPLDALLPPWPRCVPDNFHLFISLREPDNTLLESRYFKPLQSCSVKSTDSNTPN